MDGKFIKAKFNSTCAETGKQIKKGEMIFYAFAQKKAYCGTSKVYNSEAEHQATAQFIQAEQEAYFDNFCQVNNI
ncbi:MAG: hypothetical protein P8J32_04505 [bacterium]|nr:hypothetical protein [bacterium]